ncbi:MAG: uracil-DNA glycosylase family protein [Gluconacetobacter diazotrophicus]|nr:uracil-DNA glycosylase family protein [Gluconacetobacter diazotrophicus]
MDALLDEARRCRHCEAVLPLGARPILQISVTSRILVASQAPGLKVHNKGLAFWDASGDRLRAWLGLDEATFYDPAAVAIAPMGFCYPGRLPNGGDAPPRPECAPLWRPRLQPFLDRIPLTLLVGSYSQAHVLGPGTVTERVRDFRSHLHRGLFPLPHPSWRTGVWETRNPWFTEEVLPALRMEVRRTLAP